MEEKHLVVIGNPTRMPEVPDESVQLVIANSPLFEVDRSSESFHNYIEKLHLTFTECYRVLQPGRYICVNVCEVINQPFKYPTAAHYALLLKRAGFEYRDDIIWRKPHPAFPYCFPNNIVAHILVLRKGKNDYKTLSEEDLYRFEIDIDEARRRWNSELWDMRWEDKESENGKSAVFPEELAEALIRLYTYEGETVLDPFLGDGATTRAAAGLNRNSVGYTLDYSALSSLRRSSTAPNKLRIIERRCSE